MEKGMFRLKSVCDDGNLSDPIYHNGVKLKFKYVKDAYNYIMQYLEPGTYFLTLGDNGNVIWFFNKRG